MQIVDGHQIMNAFSSPVINVAVVREVVILGGARYGVR